MIVAGGAEAPGAPPLTDLLSGAALVALVPASTDLDAAAVLAWNFARTAAAQGRRIALVDCYVDEPQLSGSGDGAGPEGIVDVFEYGCSLSRIAQQQPEPNLYFVPAGTFTPDPAELMAHPRWRRLSAGFRHEDAVMLLFLPPDCIGALAQVLDGLVALAPDGAEAGLASTPEIQAAVDGGVPLLTTLTDENLPGAVAAGAAARWGDEPPGEPVAAAPRRRVSRVRLSVYGLGLVFATAVMALAYRRSLGLGDLGLSRLGGSGRTVEPPLAIVPAFRTLVPHAVDTLAFAVQVSSWTTLDFALDAGDALEGRGVPPIVAPIRVGRRLWYRVYAGPVASREAADSLLAAVRSAGLDRSRTAAAALVPLSLRLRRVASGAAARAERQRLRAAGIPTFVLGQADGAFRLYAGAYEAPEQAADLLTLATSTGSAGQLGPRVGFRP